VRGINSVPSAEKVVGHKEDQNDTEKLKGEERLSLGETQSNQKKNEKKNIQVGSSQ